MNTADLTILIPTRLRPHTVQELARAFADTCTADTTIIWCIDGCPREHEYTDAYDKAVTVYPRQRILTGPRRRLVATLNHHAVETASAVDAPFALGYLGDDHRPRTFGWDTAYLAGLRGLGSGIVYGDDGHQGANLPTQMAMTADIVRALGYLAPPHLVHMYCDNFWKDLGEGAGCLLYLPTVAVTHHHPGVGLGIWDASYRESNSADRYAADRAAYDAYRAERLAADIATVRTLRGRRP